jgi:predicted MFS family arabinose efflux permease
VLRAPGVVQPVAGTAVGALPVGMLGLAVLLLVQGQRGTFGSAGVVLALQGVGTGIGIPIQGRALDRFGHWRVLAPAAALHVSGLVGLVVAARAGAPLAVLGAVAWLAGLAEPQLTGCLRVLWADLIPDRSLRDAAYALNSIVFEVPVVLGPLLVAVLLVVGGAALAVLASGFCSALGVALLATSRASRRWRPPPQRQTGWTGALAVAGIRALVVAGAGQGAVVTLLQLAAARFALEHGRAASAGLLFSAISLGSLGGAFAWGARGWPGPMSSRLAGLFAALCAGSSACLLAGDLGVLAGMLILTGATFAPILIAGSTLLDGLAPAGRLTEAYTLIVAGGIAGVSLASAAGGRIVDRFGADGTFTAAALVAAATAGFVLAMRRTLAAGEPVDARSRGR